MTNEEAIEILRKNRPTSDPRPCGMELCEAVDMAISALRQQEPNDWICTLKCTALMDEGMCSHGGLCCLCESQRTIKENAPLTLDELRKMDGEPVWVQFLHNKIGYWYLIDCHNSEFIRFYRSGFFINGEYSKGFLAYRRKPEEG